MMIPHCMMLDVLDPYPLVLRRPTPPIPPKSQIELWFEEELAKLKAQRDTGKLPIVPQGTTPTGRRPSMAESMEHSSWQMQKIADNISRTNPLMQKMIHLQAQEAMSPLERLQQRGTEAFKQHVGENLARAEERVMQSLARSPLHDSVYEGQTWNKPTTPEKEPGWTEWQMPQQTASLTRTRQTPVTASNDYEWDDKSYPLVPGDYIASRAKDPVWARHWSGQRWSLAWYVGHMKDWSAIARRNGGPASRKPPTRSLKAVILAPLRGPIPWLPGRID